MNPSSLTPPPPHLFLFDCDGIRKVGSRPVLPQVDTPDWDAPELAGSGAWPDLDTDRFKLALLAGRVPHAAGAPDAEQSLLIARLDHLPRNDDLQAKLRATEWDLVIVDEAHKMSAHYVGGEIRETRRYRLGRLAAAIQQAGFRTVGAVITAGPHRLQAIQGVGTQTASQVVASRGRAYGSC